MSSTELFERYAIQVAEMELACVGGTLEYHVVDRPECAGGASILHVRLNDALFPLNLEMCSSPQRFHAWLFRCVQEYRECWEGVHHQNGYCPLELDW